MSNPTGYNLTPPLISPTIEIHPAEPPTAFEVDNFLATLELRTESAIWSAISRLWILPRQADGTVVATYEKIYRAEDRKTAALRTQDAPGGTARIVEAMRLEAVEGSAEIAERGKLEGEWKKTRRGAAERKDGRVAKGRVEKVKVKKQRGNRDGWKMIGRWHT